MFDTYHCDLC